MIKYIVIHHSAGVDKTRGELYIEAHRQGYREIPYNKVIHPSGQIDDGQPIGDNAANRGLNFWPDGTCASISICVVGYFHDDTIRRQIPVNELCPKFPTTKQLEALLDLVVKLRQEHKYASVIRHADVAFVANQIEHLDIPRYEMATVCPGNLFPWNRFRDHLMRRLKAVGGIPNLGKTATEDERTTTRNEKTQAKSQEVSLLEDAAGTPGEVVRPNAGDGEGPYIRVLQPCGGVSQMEDGPLARTECHSRA